MDEIELFVKLVSKNQTSITAFSDKPDFKKEVLVLTLEQFKKEIPIIKEALRPEIETEVLQGLVKFIEKMQPENKDSNLYAELIEEIVKRLQKLETAGAPSPKGGE